MHKKSINSREKVSNSFKQSPFSRVYDHSLPHSRLATGDVEGEWRTRAPIVQAARALLAATPRLSFRPACGPAGRRRSMKWVIKSSPTVCHLAEQKNDDFAAL
ncbi:unnamed protein product [Spirodela intermedia]|uniref:Uncharacterized protein n=1 Tax=Spirodela intermedia TaxID=51605 RepID=A0ABN7E8N4_SPIIN|nr:unnamed protein product [Spirodela intermedia]